MTCSLAIGGEKHKRTTNRSESMACQEAARRDDIHTQYGVLVPVPVPVETDRARECVCVRNGDGN